ncbi:3874_t:CDS:1 [Funneliformis mosseae]|uniref:3874_t:CDS:1 n=1 Tax=Funneliformis mosseae TaxID=27381 RepID=A0A9N9BFL7_FUNMO|nr:3874_t:CDS:1 [Funneliformis mosseae]
MVVFSTANATTKFDHCDKDGPFRLPLLSVTLNPDPVIPGDHATFNITGTLNTDQTRNTAIFVYYYDLKSQQMIGEKYLETICPKGCMLTKANTPFTKIVNFTAPKNLPTQYGIVVNVVEVDYVENRLGITQACAKAEVDIIPV